MSLSKLNNSTFHFKTKILPNFITFILKYTAKLKPSSSYSIMPFQLCKLGNHPHCHALSLQEFLNQNGTKELSHKQELCKLRYANFYFTFYVLPNKHYCSTPSKEKLSCLGEHYYHKILLLQYTYTYTTEVSHLLPRPTEKNQLLGPQKIYWAEILGISSNSPNLIFWLVLVNPFGSFN